MDTTIHTCNPGEGSKALNKLPQLAEPLLQFDLVSELQQLRREESWQRETGRSSKTLAKYSDFRIVLVLMKANTQMKEHRAEGRISIHHLLGEICIHLPDQKVSLTAGQLLVLDCGMVHDVGSFGRECVPAHRLLAKGHIRILMRNVLRPTEPPPRIAMGARTRDVASRPVANKRHRSLRLLSQRRSM